jgi:hypothetical protein
MLTKAMKVARADRVEPELPARHLGGEQAGPRLRERNAAFRTARGLQDHRIGRILHGLALDADIAPGRAGAQGLLLQGRLLHEPVGEAAQQVEMRPAALEAAGPEPGMVGKEQGDASLLLPVEDEERQVLRAGHDGAAHVDL